jgi:hypothetical protein
LRRPGVLPRCDALGGAGETVSRQRRGGRERGRS